jgi:hypothetical protein
MAFCSTSHQDAHKCVKATDNSIEWKHDVYNATVAIDRLAGIVTIIPNVADGLCPIQIKVARTD